MRPHPRRVDQGGARTLLSFGFCAAVIILVCGFAQAAETPQIVVVRDLQAPRTSADRGVVAPPPAQGRSIGGLVSARLNVRSETTITAETPDESISAFSPPLLSDTVALLSGFDGGTGNLSPADIGGAVGRRFVVSALNGAYYIFDKSGTQLLAIDVRDCQRWVQRSTLHLLLGKSKRQPPCTSHLRSGRSRFRCHSRLIASPGVACYSAYSKTQTRPQGPMPSQMRTSVTSGDGSQGFALPKVQGLNPISHQPPNAEAILGHFNYSRGYMLSCNNSCHWDSDIRLYHFWSWLPLLRSSAS
jgi:hypothetical protein